MRLNRPSFELLPVLALVILAFCAFAPRARAQDAAPPQHSLLSADRLSLGVGLDYAWWAREGDQSAPAPFKEFEPGVYAAYSLVPNFFIDGSMTYGADSKLLRTRLGVRLILKQGAAK